MAKSRAPRYSAEYHFCFGNLTFIGQQGDGQQAGQNIEKVIVAGQHDEDHEQDLCTTSCQSNFADGHKEQKRQQALDNVDADNAEGLKPGRQLMGVPSQRRRQALRLVMDIHCCQTPPSGAATEGVQGERVRGKPSMSCGEPQFFCEFGEMLCNFLIYLVSLTMPERNMRRKKSQRTMVRPTAGQSQVWTVVWVPKLLVKATVGLAKMAQKPASSSKMSH